MTVQHTAFLDLENGLTRRTVFGWDRLWAPLREDLRDAMLHGDWTRASRLVETINTEALIVEHAQYAQTIAISSMLLGASRLTQPESAHLVQQVPMTELKNGVVQWGFVVGRDAGRYMRRHMQIGLEALSRAVEQRRHVIKKNASEIEVDRLLDETSKAATDFSSLAASLMVSRLSSFGFLHEAQKRGLKYYEVSEVLDDRTCSVCQVMDGQVFPVAAGVAHASAIMGAEDPDSLSSIAPWPSRSKSSVASLAGSSSQNLVDRGLALPPYHPGCRGLIVASSVGTVGETATSAEHAAINRKMPRLPFATIAVALGLVLNQKSRTGDQDLYIDQSDETDPGSEFAEELRDERKEARREADQKKKKKKPLIPPLI